MPDVTLSADERPGSSTPGPETAQKWNAKYQKARMARMNFERRWYTYMAFVSGKQYFQWNYEAAPLAVGRMVEPANPGNRVRIVVNKTRRILRKELAKINKEPVRGYIKPSNTDDNSQAAARGAANLADYFVDELKIQWLFKQADWWMLQCGTSFMKIYYDPDKLMGIMKVEQPMGVPGQQQTVESDQPAYGSPVIEVVSPFHILVPNLDEQDLQRQEWVMHVTIKSTDWVEQHYGVKLDGVSLSANTLESRLLAIQGMTTENQAKGVEIREVWIKPCKDHPNGARIVATQEKILHIDQEFPYTHGQYPFIKRTYIENSIFYGATLVEDLIPLQVEYNKVRSQIIEDKNRMGRPMLAVELGSIPNIKAMRGAAGDVVEYRPGTKTPAPIPLQGIPSYIIDHVNRIAQEMAEIASQENMDGTQLPRGVQAATAIAYLQENQDALVADTIRDKELQWELLLQQCLELAAEFWDGQRLVTVSGKNGSFETFTFSKSDLIGHTSWKAVTGSATPQAYSAKQAQIMELMKMGAVPVPEALEFLDMGDTARLYEGMQVDKREAQQENIRIGNEVPVNVELWQEHLHHIMEHDDACKRNEYESWSDWSKAFMKYHTVNHMQIFLNEAGWTAPMVPDPATGQMLPDQNYVQMMQQYQMQAQQASMQKQVPVVPPMLEMTLRRAMRQLTMAPAPGQQAAPPPPTTGGPS